MKKLSFFLMAMLFSVMSFAQEAIYTLDGTITGGTSGYAEASSITQDNIAWSVTGNTTMNPWRIGGKSLTNQDRAVYSKNPIAYNIDKIELTHGTASSITVNSLKLIISDAANGAGETIDVTFKASATTTIDLPEGDYSNKYFKFLYNVTVSGNQNKYVQFTGAKFYAALAEDAVKAPVIKGAEDFISETEIAIEAEDDVTVYYTVDGTEPTTASTVYTAPFTVKETTTVKAVAYRGEKASFVTSATFTKATQVTCAEAAEAAMKVASNNATTNITYVVYGYVTELDGDLSIGQQKFWVSDTKGGENTFYSYYCNVPRALVVGDYIQMFGKLTKYNTTPQMKNGDVTLAEEPVIEEPTIECKDALDFGAVVYTDEVEGQTLEVAGYNLTSDITVTLSDDVFTVNKTTLPAEGGELVVTPATPLTVGAHSATLTLTSGEATAEVALTVVAKDVYTITWSVNGETSTTTVVEGDKLVLPVAPEAPEACSEKVFVGWTAAEEVNADGSEIEWITAATAPTAAATYYAVFAVQEGEGTLQEGQVTLAYAGGTTGNLTTGNNASTVGLDANLWNVAANKGSANNNVGVNKDNDIRLYWHAEGSNTLTVTSLVDGLTITTILITYTGDSYSNAGVLVNSAAVSGDGGSFTINANSFTITNNNTSSAQVRIKNIVINYTIGAAATYTDYSTTCEAEPEIAYEPIALSVTDLEIEMDEQVILKGTAMMQSPKDITISLVVDASEANEDGTFNLTDESEITFMGTPMTFISGVAMIDLESNMARAIVRVEFEEMYFEFTFDMTAPIPATVVVVENAIISNNAGFFFMNGTWNDEETTYPVQVEIQGFDETKAEAEYMATVTVGDIVDENGPWLGSAEGEIVATIVDGVVTVTGVLENPYTQVVLDVTISGKLPGPTVGLENLDTTVAPAKAIVNGQLVIIKNGVQYNATGAVVK